MDESFFARVPSPVIFISMSLGGVNQLHSFWERCNAETLERAENLLAFAYEYASSPNSATASRVPLTTSLGIVPAHRVKIIFMHSPINIHMFKERPLSPRACSSFLFFARAAR
jgi:hypothetical protein